MNPPEEYRYELKIPKERIAVLIGVKGKVKKDIEKETNTNIDVDSKEGDVFISGKDALSLFKAREIVKAIGRGFNPDIALFLLKPDYCFEIIDIEDYVNGKNHLKRVKGRVIGTKGKARKTVETLTDCNISVYGRTISIIGDVENVQRARKAIQRLLQGSKHGNIYKWLEKRKKERVEEELTGGINSG
ncbi:RNA-processing protein [Candidatus Woesearchaeota archaeon]|nr:RNA-processing protein [Candidatus Woesearchaeota archaeon]